MFLMSGDLTGLCLFMPRILDHLNTKHYEVRFLDESGFWVFGILMNTVVQFGAPVSVLGTSSTINIKQVSKTYETFFSE